MLGGGNHNLQIGSWEMGWWKLEYNRICVGFSAGEPGNAPRG